MTRSTLPALFVCFYSAICGEAQSLPTVPPAFQEAFTTVSGDIATFDTTVKSVWNKSTYPVMHSAQLQTANSDLTTNLLQPNYYQITVLSELNSLQALGVTTITFHINFPALLQPFYSNPAEYQSYLAFYTQLVSDLRSRGLKVVIESTIAIVYPGNNSGVFVPYYQSLDWPTYESQRAQLVASIAQLLQPDYLVVIAEPDTEAESTGQVNADTVSGSTDMLEKMLVAIQAADVPSVQVGAGCGTWDPNFLGFIESFSSLPVNFVDMHVYPVNLGNLPSALTALSIIQAAGKRPSLSEFWSYKETDAEYENDLAYTTVYARDAFSFWAPIDISFLQLMADFGNYGHFVFMTPFWSHYYAAYLDYATYGNLPDATIVTDSDTASTNANIAGLVTTTGMAYENILLKGVADTIAPSVPATPSLVSYSQTIANIAWAPSKDNVGVAAYNVYRDTKWLAAVSSPLTYYDPTLKANTTYSYTVSAFDAAGNVSAQSPPLVVTTFQIADSTPPSVPQNAAAAGVGDAQVNLSWLPSADQVGVLGYEIYRGLTPNSIAPYTVSATSSFIDTGVGPGKTYYYQVDAYNTWGIHSAPSVTFSGSTLSDSTPPTVPGNVGAVAQPGMVTLTWNPSVDDFMVTNYLIYRGISPTQLFVIGWSPATQPSFIDSTVFSGVTYYYSVVAVNVSKTQSAQSTPIAVTAQ